MSHFPSSGLFLKEECLLLFFDAFSAILINPDTPRESHSTSDTGCKDVFVVPFPSRYYRSQFRSAALDGCNGKTEHLPHLPSLTTLSPDCQQFFLKFIVNPAGFYHVHPSQQHEGYPSGWQYYCNTALTLLAPACPVIRNMTPVVMFLACIGAAGRCFTELLFRAWVLIIVVSSFEACLEPAAASPAHRVCSDIRLNQFQDVVLHESQHASAHSLGCLFLMPISREAFSRSASSIHFHQLSPDPPPRDHGRSGANSSYCNWWITPRRTVHTEGHFIVQVIYFTCKRFQRNQ